ncbi:hypothetical protein K2V59_04215 [Staphylococcus arlettae]|uniref:hypothetical protein n=1 Tax=Staphylococcus arlettae TaxID=29378 RepID=UPI001E642632|nr:hypothetical protein [Staphylococcus arlettae]MCD8888737.1 hypothetical protein [Staphylococcus arlettae]
MVEVMLDFMIGPMRQLTDVYMEHQLICNTAVIASYFAAIFVKKQRVKQDNS